MPQFRVDDSRVSPCVSLPVLLIQFGQPIAVGVGVILLHALAIKRDGNEIGPFGSLIGGLQAPPIVTILTLRFVHRQNLRDHVRLNVCDGDGRHVGWHLRLRRDAVLGSKGCLESDCAFPQRLGGFDLRN